MILVTLQLSLRFLSLAPWCWHTFAWHLSLEISHLIRFASDHLRANARVGPVPIGISVVINIWTLYCRSLIRFACVLLRIGFFLVFTARVIWELDSFGLVNKLTRTLRVCVWEPTSLVTPIQIETLLGTHRLEPTHQTTHAPHASQSLFLFQPSDAGTAHCFLHNMLPSVRTLSRC